MKQKKIGKWRTICIKVKEKSADYIKPTVIAMLIAAAGVIGSRSATNYWNKKDQEKQIFEDSRKEAKAIQRKMTNKMNDRYLYAMRCVSAYDSQIDQEPRYTDYDNSVKRWNDELIVNLSDMRRYFGEDAAKDIEDIINRFNVIHTKILDCRNAFINKKPLPETKIFLEKKVYPMDNIISNFADKLQQQSKEGKIDIYVASPPINKPVGVEVKH